MSILGERIAGARVLDLFAGSGALGLEALSRGAAHATLVELAAPSLAAIRCNVDALGAGDLTEDAFDEPDAAQTGQALDGQVETHRRII